MASHVPLSDKVKTMILVSPSVPQASSAYIHINLNNRVGQINKEEKGLLCQEKDKRKRGIVIVVYKQGPSFTEDCI